MAQSTIQSPLATDEELTCPQCRHVECICERPPASKGKAHQPPVCAACRRSAERCICKSHHDVFPLVYGQTGDPVPSRGVEEFVNEAMNLYYSRDAAGLARFIRALLSKGSTP